MPIGDRGEADYVIWSAHSDTEHRVVEQDNAAILRRAPNYTTSKSVLHHTYSNNKIDGVVKFVRFTAIENLSSCFDRIYRLRRLGGGLNPPVDVSITNEGLATRQRFIGHFQPLRTELSSTHIIALSERVALFHRAGLVHGDLCLSNIGIWKRKVYIFDWEPALNLKNGQLRSTFYCIHPQDCEQREITALTDRFSVLFLALVSCAGAREIGYCHQSHSRMIAEFLDRFQHLRLDKCTSLFLTYVKQKSLGS